MKINDPLSPLRALLAALVLPWQDGSQDRADVWH